MVQEMWKKLPYDRQEARLPQDLGALSPGQMIGAWYDVPLHDDENAAIDPGATEANAGVVAGVSHVANGTATTAGPAPTEKVN